MMMEPGAEGDSSSLATQLPWWKSGWMLIVPISLTVLLSALCSYWTPKYGLIIENEAIAANVIADPAPVYLAPLPCFALSLAACASAIWSVLHFAMLVERGGLKRSAIFMRILGVAFVVTVFFCVYFLLLVVGPRVEPDASLWFGGEVVLQWGGVLENRSEIVFESNGLWMTPIRASQY